MLTSGSKTCRTCQINYPATSDYFHVAKRNKDGLHSECKTCRRQKAKAAAKVYYQDNQAEVRANQAKAYQAKKRTVEPTRVNLVRRHNQEAVIRYRQTNPEAYRLYQRTYQQKKRAALTPEEKNKRRLIQAKSKARFWHPEAVIDYRWEDWLQALTYFNHQCAFCSSQHDVWITYVRPMRQTLLFHPTTIIPACSGCRHQKGRKPIEQFYEVCQRHPLNTFTSVRYARIQAYIQEQTPREYLSFDELDWGF